MCSDRKCDARTCGTRGFVRPLRTAEHPIYEIAGSIDGLWVKGVSTKQIQGKAGALSFEGVVLGKTMILGIGGVNPQGRPVNGQVIVSK